MLRCSREVRIWMTPWFWIGAAGNRIRIAGVRIPVVGRWWMGSKSNSFIVCGTRLSIAWRGGGTDTRFWGSRTVILPRPMNDIVFVISAGSSTFKIRRVIFKIRNHRTCQVTTRRNPVPRLPVLILSNLQYRIISKIIVKARFNDIPANTFRWHKPPVAAARDCWPCLCHCSCWARSNFFFSQWAVWLCAAYFHVL